MSAHYETLINSFKSGASAVQLVHVPHDRWPFASARANPSNLNVEKPILRVSVLDSSFNPPTLAHRALASVSLPCVKHEDISSPPEPKCFDARLLLLSVRNVDKTLKPSDATHAQRLEMMVLLANDIMANSDSATGIVSDGCTDGRDNVAVAIIDEPTFVGKSRILRAFLQRRISSLRGISAAGLTERQPELSSLAAAHVPRVQLTFVVGMDTLERILSPRYYSSDETMRDSLQQFLSSDGDDSHLVCARRITPGLDTPLDKREHDVQQTVREYIDPNRVTVVDIGNKVHAYSSSEVRARIGSHVGDKLWKEMVIDDIAAFVEKHHLYTSGTDTNKA